jgi:asparagine synthase (glutamine-hydrolysing)
MFLQLLGWAIRLGDVNEQPLSAQTRDSFRRATEFLACLVDEKTGWAPNYGANDGALVLPLSDCGYPDMRPALQACYFVAERSPLYSPGPWDEEMGWVNGAASLTRSQTEPAPAPQELNAAEGGCYTLRYDHTWAMLRATRYKDRPSHADQLHLDLCCQGQNLFCDPGTYSYNAAPPFADAFASTRYHNTVTVDGDEQMTRVSRFLWGDWAMANAQRYRLHPTGASVLEGEHDGYARMGVLHRRAVAFIGECWVVIDDLRGTGHHTLRLHWLLADAPFQCNEMARGLHCRVASMRLDIFCSRAIRHNVMRAGHLVCGTLEGDVDKARGWTSRYYGRLDPALSLAVHASCILPVRFITVIAPACAPEITVSPDLDIVRIDARTIELSPISHSPMFRPQSV